jgi:hypothetical protein
MNAYLVSHNGLGDNLYMIGAVRYLVTIYEKVSFLCKRKYYNNVCQFFSDLSDRVVCIPFDENNEFSEIKQIIGEKYNDPTCDIFVAGFCHKEYLTSKITNPRFLNDTFREIKKETPGYDYSIDFGMLTTANYGFIENFYTDIGLSLTHFYDYFNLPHTNDSQRLYESVRNYYIVFIQLTSSDGVSLNISELLDKYLNDPNVVLICNDKNLYSSENMSEKYNLCQPFVYGNVVNYVDTIQNADEIYIIDSCFTGIVLPYAKMGRLKAPISKIHIILRAAATKGYRCL